jgi:hypothetical protein
MFSMSVSAYLQQQDECPKCCKTVYKNEEVLALGVKWHKECFTCGGVSDLGCQRTLQPGAFETHDKVAYCTSCSGKNFGLGAARGSIIRVGRVSSTQSSGDCTDSEQSVTSPIKETKARRASLRLGSQASCDDRKCHTCQRTVYAMEELRALGKLWHKECFTCGGTDDLGCGRTLQIDNFEACDNMPYCKACFNKQFKHGAGRGSAVASRRGSFVVSHSTTTRESWISTFPQNGSFIDVPTQNESFISPSAFASMDELIDFSDDIGGDDIGACMPDVPKSRRCSMSANQRTVIASNASIESLGTDSGSEIGSKGRYPSTHKHVS